MHFNNAQCLSKDKCFYKKAQQGCNLLGQCSVIAHSPLIACKLIEELVSALMQVGYDRRNACLSEKIHNLRGVFNGGFAIG